LRSAEIWHGEQVVALAEMISKNRADSLQFRIENEDILVAKAMQRPLFGWGAWGRGRVYDEWGNNKSITDGRWIIVLGAHGIVGVAAFFAALLLPLTILISRFPVRRLLLVEMAPVLALGVVVAIYAIDNLPNAMSNPVFMFTGGAVVGFVVAPRRARETVHRGELHGTRDATAESVTLRRLHPGSV
jgi:hypothetical protein